MDRWDGTDYQFWTRALIVASVSSAVAAPFAGESFVYLLVSAVAFGLLAIGLTPKGPPPPP